MSHAPLNLILVRHGNTFEPYQTPVQVGLKTNIPLTTQGRVQATQIAQHLKGYYPTSKIYSGDLSRQSESAAIIAEHFNLTPFYESALNEIDYGLWEGLPVDEIKSKWSSLHHDWEEAAFWPKAIFKSSLEVHVAKLRTWLESLKKNAEENPSVVAVTSNGIIRLFLYFSDLNWSKLTQNRELAKYKVKTGHFCHLSFEANGLKIHQWNAAPTI